MGIGPGAEAFKQHGAGRLPRNRETDAARENSEAHKVAHALCGPEFDEEGLAYGDHDDDRERSDERSCRYLDWWHRFEIVDERRQNGVNRDAKHRGACCSGEGREKNRSISRGNNIAAREGQRCAVALPSILIVI